MKHFWERPSLGLVTRLTPAGFRVRGVILLALSALLLALARLSPDAVPAWFPFATSCGAITGLPCIFCGATRAMHHLLHGEFGLALYCNWLAYPVLAGACAIFFLAALELLLDRSLLAHLPRPRLTRSSAGALAAGVVLLWFFQAYLAVSQDKAKLLNPSGPLYSLLVR